MQQRTGHLSPYAMMDHCGFIMAHGRESRVYRRLPVCRAIEAQFNGHCWNRQKEGDQDYSRASALWSSFSREGG